jgi:hypothetical protein
MGAKSKTPFNSLSVCASPMSHQSNVIVVSPLHLQARLLQRKYKSFLVFCTVNLQRWLSMKVLQRLHSDILMKLLRSQALLFQMSTMAVEGYSLCCGHAMKSHGCNTVLLLLHQPNQVLLPLRWWVAASRSSNFASKHTVAVDLL